jgi:DNA-binding Xre family transcriptional regulator
LQQNSQRIEKKVAWLYQANRIAFDAANILPETAKENLIDVLKWRLQCFDPKRMKGEEKTKLPRYFSMGLSFSTLELKRTAWKKYGKTKKISIEGVETERNLKDILPAPQKAAEITVEKLQGICSQLKLNPLQEAVLFGRCAGLTDKQIGEALGYTQGNITRIKQAFKKKVGKQLLEEI